MNICLFTPEEINNPPPEQNNNFQRKNKGNTKKPKVQVYINITSI